MFHESRLIKIFIHGWRSTKQIKIVTRTWKDLTTLISNHHFNKNVNDDSRENKFQSHLTYKV